MMGRMNKKALVKRLLSQVDIRDVPQAAVMVDQYTALEGRAISSANRLSDAADVDVSMALDQDERTETLLDFADAASNREFREWWFDEYADSYIDNPEEAREYADLSLEEWQADIERWASLYREADVDVEGLTDAQIADLHVRSKFGVDLATFALEVVNWSVGQHLEAIMLGNLLGVLNVMDTVAAELERRDDAP